MYETSICYRVWVSLNTFPFLVGARVQVLSPRVYTSSSMMDILRVSSTALSWCGCCVQTHVEKTRKEHFFLFFYYRNLVLPTLCQTLQLNNPCSTKSWLTPDALDLLTWSPACALSRSILWWRLLIIPLTFSHSRVFDLRGDLVWMASSSFVILMYLLEKVYLQRYTFAIFFFPAVEIWGWEHFLIGPVRYRRLRWWGNVCESKQSIHSENWHFWQPILFQLYQYYVGTSARYRSTHFFSQNLSSWTALIQSSWRTFKPST